MERHLQVCIRAGPGWPLKGRTGRQLGRHRQFGKPSSMTQLPHKACDHVFRKGRVGGDTSVLTLQCLEHHLSQMSIYTALAPTRGSQSQRRPSSCCQWPRTSSLKATFYSLLRAFPVCWRMLLTSHPDPTASFTPAASILVPGTVGSLTVPNSSPASINVPL